MRLLNVFRILIDEFLNLSNKYPIASINFFIGILLFIYINRFGMYNEPPHSYFSVSYEEEGCFVIEEWTDRDENGDVDWSDSYGPFKTAIKAEKEIEKIKDERENKLQELDFLGIRYYPFYQFYFLIFFIIGAYDIYRIYYKKIAEKYKD